MRNARLRGGRKPHKPTDVKLCSFSSEYGKLYTLFGFSLQVCYIFVVLLFQDYMKRSRKTAVSAEAEISKCVYITSQLFH